MIDPNKFYRFLSDENVHFFSGVPDSLLNDFCIYLSDSLSDQQHVIAANEGNAVGIAAGHYLATGEIPLVYMQNSGIGNALNPLISLTNKETYSIPMILLVGWRGAPGEKDWAHHKKQGEVTPALLTLLDIPYKELDNDTDLEVLDIIRLASKTTNESKSPVAILVRKGVLEKGEKKDLTLEASDLVLTRENAIEAIIKIVPEDSLFVTTTGRATREMCEIRKKLGMSYERDFLNVGSMGHASSIAMGLAIANQNRLVVCLDGDASALMHMGSFAIIGSSQCTNMLHVILNNGAHESVGGQPSVAHRIEFTGIAQNSGYYTSGNSVCTKEEIETAIHQLLKVQKPKFLDVRIRKGIRSDIPPLSVSLTEIKNNIMKL